MENKSFQTELYSYKAESLLAQGGMGSLYLGRRTKVSDRSAHDEVVFKQLPPEHAHDPRLIDLFKREAKLVHLLSHKNIVRVFDLVETTQNGVTEIFIVMEYVRGGDLHTLLRRAKRRQAKLSLDSIFFVTCELLAALSYAHEKRNKKGEPLGLVHRDVSPSNILLGANGVVKLTDFGIARNPTQGSVVFNVKGKIGYMAPEQARGGIVDRRADLFAVGVTLYELLVGERLFVGSALQSPAQIFAQPVVAPSRTRSDVSAELDAIVLRALALDRDARWSTAEEMRTALFQLGRRMGLSLDERTLASDLLRACGNDPSAWRGPDAPMGATLDGGPPSGSGDGTGVIPIDDEPPLARPFTTRPISLPEHELTSIVRLTDDADFDPPPTLVQREPRGLHPTPDHDEPDGDDVAPFDDDRDSEVQTRVQEPEHIAVGLRPRQLAARAARAVFEPPVQRTSPPLPSEHSLHAQPAFLPAPTTRSSSEPLKVLEPPAAADVTRRRPTKSAPPVEAPRRPLPVPVADAKTSAIPTYGPASLAALERNISGRTTGRLVLTVLAVAVLVALGIGLGVMLSGDPLPPGTDPISNPASTGSPR
ncbi:MAG: protein kinase [Polyangia bacterium]